MLTATRRANEATPKPLSRIPRQLIAGLALVAVAWPLAWFGPAGISQYTFLPLWLGYILTVDGVVEHRSGTSLLRRSRSRFLALFLVSIPFWWVFEALNERLGNWEYLYRGDVGFVERHVRASIAFSTVVPALFETAELYSTTRLPRRLGYWLRITPSARGLAGISVLGVLMILVVLVFPRQVYPLIWLGFFFALDPVVHLLGGRSISAQVARGRWDTIVALFAAGITCGLFWEMWNSLSMPKWVYHVPYVGAPKLFEMPILGYGGYFPFALEVYATVQAINLLTHLLPHDYLRFDEPAG